MDNRAENSRDTTISVIIATMNCADCLAAALDSVFCQLDAADECIVIDGGSTDGTIEIIRQRQHRLTSWLSEADSGIAEAFNKGVERSSGRLLYFLGADDVLHDPMVLRDVRNSLLRFEEPYFFYGDLFYIYGRKKKLIHRNFDPKKNRRYNCMPHQAMFLDRWFFETYGLFDETYRYAMDYEHISRFIDEYPPRYLERLIACMHRFGHSTDVLSTHAEMDRVRLARGWATEQQVRRERLVLKLQLLFARTLGLNW